MIHITDEKSKAEKKQLDYGHIAVANKKATWT